MVFFKKNGYRSEQKQSTRAQHQLPPFCLRVILSPKLRAIPWVLLLIRMYPLSFPSNCFSMLTLTRASSPKTLLAYKFAARKPQSPSSADLKFNHPRERFVKYQLKDIRSVKESAIYVCVCVCVCVCVYGAHRPK